MDRYSDYDPFADLYNRRWGWFAASILPVLDRLALDDLDDGATVLDLCCGTGQLLAALGERSFRLIGIDGSAEMVGHASRNAPDAELLVDDARSFETDRPVDAVVSTFDSLNHLMTADDLAAVFGRVAAVLKAGGRFVFDLNTDEGFRARWQGPFNLVDDDEVIVARSTYDEAAGTASLALTCFVPLDGPEPGSWSRQDLHFTERCHPDGEIRSGLAAAGFAAVECWDANDFEGFDDVGRSIYRATAPA